MVDLLGKKMAEWKALQKVVHLAEKLGIGLAVLSAFQKE